MKEIKIQVTNISPGQWSTLILELNNMSKSWRRFGPDIKLQAASITRIIAAGQVKASSRKRQALATFKK
tara:strand:- start:288 stop:494 length:207 start_codon:yes stop_codon:yes gene_type:complete